MTPTLVAHHIVLLSENDSSIDNISCSWDDHHSALQLLDLNRNLEMMWIVKRRVLGLEGLEGLDHEGGELCKFQNDGHCYQVATVMHFRL